MRLRQGLVLGPWLFVLACGTDNDGLGGNGSAAGQSGGGASSSGGKAAGGQSAPSGGKSSAGGSTARLSTATGGTVVGGPGGSSARYGGSTSLGSSAGSTSSKGGSSITGGATGSGGTTSTKGGSTSAGGTSGSGGSAGAKGGSTVSGGTAAGGTSVSGGRSQGGTTAAGGTTATGGGSTASGGSSLGGNTPAGGQTGGAGGTSQSTGSPATDAIGQNPFSRPATSGVLITSSDGLNSTELLLAADTHDGMFVTGATRNPQAMGLAAFDPGIESEAFAARLDAQGKLLWAVPLKTCGVPADIAAGPEDSVFVLCPYQPDMATLMPSTCNAEAVVEKLAGGDGQRVFEARVKVPADPADGYLCPYGLGVDPQGRSYVGGGYSGVFRISRTMVSAVSASGQQDWTFISDGSTDTTGNGPNAYPNDVAVDSSGNVLFAGSFNNWMKLGTIQLTSDAVFEQYSMYNGYIGRLSSSGTSPAGWKFGGTVFDMATAIEPTSNGGFLISGMASSASAIGGKTVTASADGSAFIARYGSDGQATWAKSLTDESIAWDVAMTPDGKAHFVGSFTGNELMYTYDPVADQLTSRKTIAGDATTNELRTTSIAVTTAGAVWITGTFIKTINLGTGALTTSTVGAFLWRVN